MTDEAGIFDDLFHARVAAQAERCWHKTPMR
jgi:hypothetical protein